VYVDNLNIIGNTQDIDEAHNHLKTEFEMKDLGQTIVDEVAFFTEDVHTVNQV
jgi:hypothetical protein